MRGDAVPAGQPVAGQPDRGLAGAERHGRHEPTASTRPRRAGADRSGDSYLPEHGNGGYRVRALRPRPRLPGRVRTGSAGRADDHRGRPTSRCRGSASTSVGFRVDRRPGRRARRRGTPTAAASCGSARRGRSAPGTPFTVEVRYAGKPAAGRRAGGATSAGSELTDGVLVASQPIGAPSWFPCNDHPADKATYRIAVTTAVAVHGASPPATWSSRAARRRHHDLGVRAARADGDRTWRACRSAATSWSTWPAGAGAAAGGGPAARCAAASRHDFGRHGRDDGGASAALRPVPVRRVRRGGRPTTTWRSRSRRRACRSSAPTTSTGGARTSGWSPTSWPTSGSATA